MLAVLNRYRLLLLILLLVIIAALIWFYISLHSNGKTPSRGVFVMVWNSYSHCLRGGCNFCSR